MSSWAPRAPGGPAYPLTITGQQHCPGHEPLEGLPQHLAGAVAGLQVQEALQHRQQLAGRRGAAHLEGWVVSAGTQLGLPRLVLGMVGTACVPHSDVCLGPPALRVHLTELARGSLGWRPDPLLGTGAGPGGVAWQGGLARVCAGQAHLVEEVGKHLLVAAHVHTATQAQQLVLILGPRLLKGLQLDQQVLVLQVSGSVSSGGQVCSAVAPSSPRSGLTELGPTQGAGPGAARARDKA